MTANKKKQYTGSSISVLEGLEAVRVRPGMYIGSTGPKGLHHLVWEILDNSIDEHLEGFCSEIVITHHKDGSVSVRDNGRGIPVDVQPDKGISAERLIFTTLHAGGKFNNENYKVSGGLHGVGAAVVNALSEWLQVDVYKDGYHYQDKYENGGQPVQKLTKKGELKPIAETNMQGTSVRFKPDATIFDTVKFQTSIIKKRLQELAFLNRGLKLIFIDELEEDETLREVVYFEESGIEGFVRSINETTTAIHDKVFYLEGKDDTTEVEVAFQYTSDSKETILSFCNNINTIEGGTHVSGFKTALTRIVNQYARELNILKEKQENFEGKDVRSGITAIVLIRHQNPQYEGQTKTKLGNADARRSVEEVLGEQLPFLFDKNPKETEEIVNNALKNYKLRKVEARARSNFLNKQAKLSVNGKLAACSSRKVSERELIIVEGNSAGGTAKQARDRKTQAILPLRGKILNVEKSNISKIFKNQEIATLISAIGTGFGEGFGDDFDIEKRKYDKIIILTDADVDGAHIRTLILTFFYRYMPELIYEGKVFIGIPPLYKVQTARTSTYLYSDQELAEYRKKSRAKNFTLQRYKGLGEMNPEQLWDTTLNPKTRLLKRVTIDDAAGANQITSVLMGNKVPPRREFIYEHATFAELDL